MAGNLLARSAHDLGAAAWFGGTLMGAVGLNGATGKAKDPKERTRLSALGWAKWTPVQIAAFAVHAVGGIGLILGNKGRLASQDTVGSNTVWKSVITLAGMALSRCTRGSSARRSASSRSRVGRVQPNRVPVRPTNWPRHSRS
ncbi:hypothetical protein MN0502_06180 [Arthrobacter sp. MN05-02]|nr:hypothetical protein MN0502_06180 [Arthrobacter sp. MN05-02]